VGHLCVVMGVEGIVGDVNEMAEHYFLAQDINFVCKEGLWRLRSRNLFFGFLFHFWSWMGSCSGP
jgi:hypothetical protein